MHGSWSLSVTVYKGSCDRVELPRLSKTKADGRRVAVKQPTSRSSSDDHRPGGSQSTVAGSVVVVFVAVAELQSEASFPVAEVETSPAQRQSAFSDDSPRKEGLLQMSGQGSVLGHSMVGCRILYVDKEEHGDAAEFRDARHLDSNLGGRGSPRVSVPANHHPPDATPGDVRHPGGRRQLFLLQGFSRRKFVESRSTIRGLFHRAEEETEAPQRQTLSSDANLADYFFNFCAFPAA